MCILRHKIHRSYTVLPNHIVNLAGPGGPLELQDLGLIAFVFSKPDNWQTSYTLLKKQLGIGNDKLNQIVKRLKATGILTIDRETSGETEWIFTDTPETRARSPHSENPNTENPNTENPNTENRNVLINTERAISTERDNKLILSKDSIGHRGSVTPPCPHQEIINLYHRHLPMCRPVRVWNETRKRYLKTRWAEDPDRQDLEWWQGFFEHIAESEFLTGRSQASNGHGPFVADLEWIVRPNNFSKIYEGKYHG